MVSPVMALRSLVGWPRFSDPSLQGPLNIQAVAATACKGRNASTTGAMTATAIVAFISPPAPPRNNASARRRTSVAVNAAVHGTDQSFHPPSSASPFVASERAAIVNDTLTG